MTKKTSFFVPVDEKFEVVDGLWNGYSLILPCVSVGNVPQLVVDLLINSCIQYPDGSNSSGDVPGTNDDLQLVGYIRSKCVRPFAGPDPFRFQGNLLATSIQVFVSEKLRLVIIQQRSPIFKELRNQFYSKLFDFLSLHKFSQTLILASSFDHFLMPEELFPSSGDNVDNNNQNTRQFPIKYLVPEKSSEIDLELKSFLEDREQVKSIPLVDPYTMKPDNEHGKIHLPGSGSARSYLKLFQEQMSNSEDSSVILCLVIYCSEGDNRMHAFRMADKVANIVNYHRNKSSSKNNDGVLLGPSNKTKEEFGKWETPFSWRSMFGDEPPAGIF